MADDNRLVRVKVVSGARRESVQEGERSVMVMVRERPQNNRANRRVIALIAQHFCVAEKEVRIIAGHKRPNKTLSIGVV